MNMLEENKLMRRVAGYHDLRMDGMLDLVIRARGATVLDIGCNRGLVGFEMANNGARVVHGCDIDKECVIVARHLFHDLRNVESRFEVVDLTQGTKALEPFGTGHYDIVLMLATYHKIKRVMPANVLAGLMHEIGKRTFKFFGWRATSDKPSENEAEMGALDHAFGPIGLKRVHTSTISLQLGLAAIWARL